MLRHLLAAAAVRTQHLVCGQDSGKVHFTNCLKKKPVATFSGLAIGVLTGITRLGGSDAGGE